ncbi:something about silencing protein 10-like [Biomphalaria glabrata]|uniref:Something about silencing protein 10-like n=1 Tax=Biomphalaria glabrata TaxID=6526 RepID=A0A9W2ZRV1_BIOGL|nr:something about silencing protein 10-like [Biomphalaria glabrata]
MKKQGKKGKPSKKDNSYDNESEEEIGDIFTDEINEFTEAKNKVDLEEKNSESEEEEELFGLLNEEDESDEELDDWSKRLKQIKFQAKLEKKRSLPGDGPEKSWGNKRGVFYGSGVKRKPKQTASDEEDEWTMEEKEIEKLQKRLDEDVDEDDFILPSLTKKIKEESNEFTIKRDLTAQEKEEFKKKIHPEAEPLREELNKCIEELESLKEKKGWKYESRETCFRLLAGNIAFYLHLIESDEECRGHPVIKRIVQLKKLAKMYEAIPEEQMEASDASGDESTDDEDVKPNNSIKRQRLDLTGSEEEDDDIDDDDEKEKVEESEEKEPENRPIGYEIMKNKPKKKTAPNNPRVKHREKFRKAKIRRKGKYRDYRPEINKYQGEASGIRAGIIRSVRLK